MVGFTGWCLRWFWWVHVGLESLLCFGGYGLVLWGLSLSLRLSDGGEGSFGLFAASIGSFICFRF